MKISSSVLGMESERTYRMSGRDAYMLKMQGGQSKLKDGSQSRGLLSSQSGWTGSGGRTSGISRSESISGTSSIAEMTAQCLNYLLRILFGEGRDLSNYQMEPLNAQGGMAMVYGSYSETETTSFSTVGKVRTEDGREIGFGLSLKMSRSFTETYAAGMNIAPAELCDPLVINLDTAAAKVSDQKFYFDIDGDGEKDLISRLGSGSGYLALDRDGNGKIDDGSELFGAASGDGFSDLAGMDEDGNGWIDENDRIFEKLRIWVKDENGEDRLYGLAEKGVGAICLGSARTDFSLNSMRDNRVNGVVRKTGIFLYENGNAGTVQHLDLAR